MLADMPSKTSKPKSPPKRRRLLQPDPSVDQNAVDNGVPSADSKSKIKSADVTGLKYFAMLAPLLERLHQDACQRDKAKQRDLHYDQYCMLVLLYLFNPVITSLRAIEQASELKKVQKKLGCTRASLGSLSEASRIFEADRLKEIIAELGTESQSLDRHEKLRPA